MDLYSSIPELLQVHGLVMAVGAAAFGWAVAFRERYKNNKLKTELDAQAKVSKSQSRVPRLSLPSLTLALEEEAEEMLSVHTCRRLEVASELQALKHKVHDADDPNEDELLSAQEAQLEALQNELAELAEGLRQGMSARGESTSPFSSPRPDSSACMASTNKIDGRLNPLSLKQRSASASDLQTIKVPSGMSIQEDLFCSIPGSEVHTPIAAAGNDDDSPKALSVLESLLDDDESAGWLLTTGQLTDNEDEALMMGEDDDAGLLVSGHNAQYDDEESEEGDGQQAAFMNTTTRNYRVRVMGFTKNCTTPPKMHKDMLLRSQEVECTQEQTESKPQQEPGSVDEDDEEVCVVTARELIDSSIPSNTVSVSTTDEMEVDTISLSKTSPSSSNTKKSTTNNNYNNTSEESYGSGNGSSLLRMDTPSKALDPVASRTPPQAQAPVPRLSLSRLSPGADTPLQLSARTDTSSSTQPLPNCYADGIYDAATNMSHMSPFSASTASGVGASGFAGLSLDFSSFLQNEQPNCDDDDAAADDGPVVRPLPRVPKLKLTNSSPSLTARGAGGSLPTFSARGGVPRASSSPLTARRTTTSRSRSVTPERTPLNASSSSMSSPLSMTPPSGSKTARGRAGGKIPAPPSSPPSFSPGIALSTGGKENPTPRLVGSTITSSGTVVGVSPPPGQMLLPASKLAGPCPTASLSRSSSNGGLVLAADQVTPTKIPRPQWTPEIKS